MGAFDDETAVVERLPGEWSSVLSARWSIDDTANGGYALTPVLRAMGRAGGHPDPLSVTTHFLRPVRPRSGGVAAVRTAVVRQGRTTTVCTGTLEHDGSDRLTAIGAFGDVDELVGVDLPITVPPPEIPPPDACVHRSELAQGVDLAILDRLDVRIHPDHAVSGAAPAAVLDGRIRFADGTDPTALALPLFTDAFPPSLYVLAGRVGWVPTIELTVHVRRRPVAGWIQARFECDDLSRGRMIESGSLWDASGALVARSRQLGLLLAR